jgi:protoporphyrin/coproporphyrin ferrochelatase
MSLPDNHPPVAASKVGLLLVNLGTPDAPTPSAVKRYLKQFLSDRRVVEIPPLIWQPILRGFILTTRPKKSAAAYAKVWTDKGSPLAFFTAAQAEAMAKRMGDAVHIRYAMRYGQPSIERQLTEMKAAGCNRILIAPLYPQHSGATTATVLDESALAARAPHIAALS